MWRTHVDPTVLADYKAKHLLKSQTHPRLPLTIWNYAPECQYSKDKWDSITTLCRGLIVDTETHEIVGRSFRKFWNEGEKLYTPTDTFTVWEKMDGSLGILFHYKGQWILSSRGSFTSQQAMKAQQLIEQKYDVSGLDVNTSYVFEIVYPENRIVIDYGTTEALYFLAAFKRTGEEIFPPPTEQIQAAGFPLCPSYPEYTDYAQLHTLDWANHEGFVIRFSTGERMKIKFENYLELHRMATNLSTKSVYDWFCEKKTLADLLEISPDEFHPWVKEQWGVFKTAYDTLFTELQAHVATLAHLTQKEFAAHIVDAPYKGLLFSLRLGKDIFTSLCKEIKPTTQEQLPWGPKTIVTQPTQPTQPTQITILLGIAGSGKSTYAKTCLNTQPNTVIVSRDSIREQLFGYEPQEMSRYYEAPQLVKKEELVTQVEHAQMDAAIAAGYDIIIDDTNLTQKVIKSFFQRFPTAKFQYHICECTVKDAVERCSQRARRVSPTVIQAQYAKFVVLVPYLEDMFQQQQVSASRRIAQDSEKPRAIIVDLDGTLAIHTGRNPYDWSRVEEDALNEAVAAAAEGADKQTTKIILCSGRSEEARAGTERWLAKHNITYESLHMRPMDDQRPDYLVKEDMWRVVTKEYYILYMLDDRNSVVNHARSLGFTVFQVAPGNF